MSVVFDPLCYLGTMKLDSPHCILVYQYIGLLLHNFIKSLSLSLSFQKGGHKILDQYILPLTGKNCVIITELVQ